MVKKNTFQIISEYIQALVGAILLAVLIRGFLVEPFKIPSESMLPTLLVGDHIFVARYHYGLRVPLTKKWLMEFDDPKRGDVVVFTYPEDEDVDFIKRVVGIPGDKISIKNDIVNINGEAAKYQPIIIEGQDPDNNCNMNLSKETKEMLPERFHDFPHYLKVGKFNKQLETLADGNQHMIQRSKTNPLSSDYETTVPEGHFFVMGDNRDYSHDSRFWGFVPREYLKGKAVFVWLSLNHEKTNCEYNPLGPDMIPHVRWDRFGKKIY